MNLTQTLAPSPEGAAPQAAGPDASLVAKVMEGKEAPASTDPVTPPKQEPGKLPSEALAAIAKERKRTLMYQKQLQADRAKFDQERQSWTEKLSRFEQADNPIAALQAKGWTYEDATNFVLNSNKFTPEHEVKTLREELDKRFKDQEEKEQLRLKQQAEEEQKRAAQVIEDFKTSVTEFVTSRPDQYELINTHEAHEYVYDTIQEHFNQTKRVMKTEEAADLVEKYLESQVQKALETKKFKSKFQQAPEKETKPTGSGQQPPKTLSNTMSSTSPSLLPAATEQDRIARALAALG